MEIKTILSRLMSSVPALIAGKSKPIVSAKSARRCPVHSLNVLGKE